MSEIRAAIQKACTGYKDASEDAVTDFYVNVTLDSGDLKIVDDDDRLLSQATIGEWADYKDEEDEELLSQIARDIRRELDRLDKEGYFNDIHVMRPYSFVLVDDEKEVIEDLYLADDDNVIIGSGLMEGLDAELDEFLDNLLGEDE